MFVLVLPRSPTYIGQSVGHAAAALSTAETAGHIMARTVRDASLESRAARSRLKARGKPYWRLLEEGLHLGYRKGHGRPGRPAGAGKWVVRHYVGEQSYAVQTIAEADDFSDADGTEILSFKQAQEAARERRRRRAHDRSGKAGPLTVKAAVESYLEFLDTNRKSGADARYRANAFILPKLGDIEVEDLTTDKLRRWHAELAKQPPRRARRRETISSTASLRTRTKAGGSVDRRQIAP